MEPHLGWSLGTRVINVMKKKDAVPRSSIRPEPRANGATPRVDLAQQLPMGEDQPVRDWQHKELACLGLWATEEAVNQAHISN